MASSKYVNFLEGMLLGGSLGAVVTFMFGTKEGKKIQEKLVRKYRMLEHKADHYQKAVQKAVKSPMARKLKRLAKTAISNPPKKHSRKRHTSRRKKAHR